jgi:hypothetical protein
MSPLVPTLKCINLAAPSVCGMSIVAYSAKFLIDDIFPRIMARPHCVQTPARALWLSHFLTSIESVIHAEFAPNFFVSLSFLVKYPQSLYCHWHSAC